MNYEIWKEIDYPNYFISSYGNFKGPTGKIRRLFKNHEGYFTTNVRPNGRMSKNICLKIHRLVAKAFISNPKNLPCVNHKDGNKLNNHITNLEWCTYQYNTQHALQNGLLDNYINKYDVPIICLPDMIIYKSITEAGKQFTKPNMNRDTARKNISHALNHNGMAYGKYWEYYE